MKKLALTLFVLAGVFTSCSDDDIANNSVTAPQTYNFTRNGNSTVSFSGQTTRLLMAEDIITAFIDITSTEGKIDAMFSHTKGEPNFTDVDLNASDKSVRSKVAASIDYFSANTTDANAIKADFDAWIKGQVDSVFPNWEINAASGVAGKIQEAGGGTVRYINEKGLEYNEAFTKGLIGALMVDQTLNNYLSAAVLDEATSRADNNAEKVILGNNYTNMEHKWDEAYGYIFGLNANAANPNLDLGADSFFNKYLGRVENDNDFKGIANDIFQAFKLGRAAIVAKNYDVRDQQAEILKEKISEIIGIRAVYYLQQAKPFLTTDRAAAFHDLSEGFGFIYSLQFTRKPNTNEPYFTKSEVDAFIATLTKNNGFWDITEAELDTMSNTISAAFNFTTAQAATTN